MERQEKKIFQQNKIPRLKKILSHLEVGRPGPTNFEMPQNF